MSLACAQPGCDDPATHQLMRGGRHAYPSKPVMCEPHVRLWRLIDGFRPGPVNDHRRGRLMNRVVVEFDVEPLRRLIGQVERYDEAWESGDGDACAAELAAFEAMFPDAATETVTALAGPFNAAAADYTAGKKRSVVGSTMFDLRDIRDYVAMFGAIRADAPHQLDIATRYTTLGTVDAAEGVWRVLAKHDVYSGQWADMLRVPGVTELRWRSIADQAAHIATLNQEGASAGSSGVGPTSF